MLRVILDDLTDLGVHGHLRHGHRRPAFEAANLDWAYGSAALRATAEDLALMTCGREVRTDRPDGLRFGVTEGIVTAYSGGYEYDPTGQPLPYPARSSRVRSRTISRPPPRSPRTLAAIESWSVNNPRRRCSVPT